MQHILNIIIGNVNPAPALALLKMMTAITTAYLPHPRQHVLMVLMDQVAQRQINTAHKRSRYIAAHLVMLAQQNLVVIKYVQPRSIATHALILATL